MQRAFWLYDIQGRTGALQNVYNKRPNTSTINSHSKEYNTYQCTRNTQREIRQTLTN